MHVGVDRIEVDLARAVQAQQDVSARTWGLNGLAYDGGRLIWVRNHGADYPYDVHVEAIDAASGATIWNNNLHAAYGAGAYPTVANGELYVLGNSPGSLLYALRQSDGTERWARAVAP